ncbi:MAG: hypothetical protein IT457_14095 [Planctomycetes bacterium]|nr:hypothetical protein [Planctomycetota bacterium]
MLAVRFAVLVVVALAASACSTPKPGPLDPRPVHERESWAAEANGTPLGRVVLLEIDDPAGPVRLYRVENASGQWLGWVDVAGRVWQRVPFQADEQFLGVYPMEKGLALLYEVEVPVRLAPQPDGPAEASHRRSRQFRP